MDELSGHDRYTEMLQQRYKDELSVRDRYTEMLQQRYDPDVIREAPDLEPGDEHPSVVEVQNFLKRFGYLDAALRRVARPNPDA